MSSLAEAAETKIFEKLCELVAKENAKSVFAVGGTIPITSLEGHLICESDESVSEAGSGSGVNIAGNITDEDDSDGDSENGYDSYEGSVNDDASDKDVSRTANAEVATFSVPHKMRCDPVTIRWDSDGNTVNKVTLPCTDAEQPNLEQLLKDCQPATFGRGGQDVLDETYRKAGKLDVIDFCSNFNPYALGIIDTVTHALIPKLALQTNESHGLRAELYKLNESRVYSAPSGKFKAHIDTPRSKHQLGSLVVCLPTVHEGGQLVVRHHGREQCFDWTGEKGSNVIQWAAFYSDCEHEVLEVTAGHRITLTYNLYSTCASNVAPLDTAQEELYQTMKNLIQSPAFCQNGITLGYNCTHAYPHTTKEMIPTLPATFKGFDKVVYECLVANHLEVSIRQHLKFRESYYNAEHEVIGYGENDTTDNEDSRYRSKEELRRKLRAKFANQFERKTDPKYGGKYWDRKEEHKRAGDLAILNEGLHPLSLTDWGFNDGLSFREIATFWNKDVDVECVKWLNSRNKKQLALVHGAYGNNAEMGMQYSGLVMTVKIPPFNER